MAWYATMVMIILFSVHNLVLARRGLFLDQRGCNCSEQGLWSQSSEHCKLHVFRIDIASAMNKDF